MPSLTTPRNPVSELQTRLSGLCIFLISPLLVLAELAGQGWALPAAIAALLAMIALEVPRVGWVVRLFVAIGLAMAAVAVLTTQEGAAMLARPLANATFIAGFFAALTTLRTAAQTSPSIEKCGRFLASQRPGRRYATLNLGGHVFSIVLGYGAISLLGTMTERSIMHESDEPGRTIKLRRMLLAIQRGMGSMLSWSPMAFPMAISVVLVDGATWSAAALPCLVTALLLSGVGWTLDTVLETRPARAGEMQTEPEGTWRDTLPLLMLLVWLMASVGGVHIVLGISAAYAAMIAVPLIAVGWIAVQFGRRRGLARHIGQRAWHYVGTELSDYRQELVLLVMSGFIGTLGASLLLPLVGGISAASLPVPVLLLAIFWFIPLTGQMGMNPILTVSLLVPLLPAVQTLGITPTMLILTITSGWAIGTMSSPFTATTLLVGRIARVSARRVGAVWNGPYTLVSGAVLSIWLMIFYHL